MYPTLVQPVPPPDDCLAEEPPVEKSYQFVNQKSPPNRSLHVWNQRPDGTYKCVLCGGVAKEPSLNEPADRYEPLTDGERNICKQSLRPAACASGGVA